MERSKIHRSNGDTKVGTITKNEKYDLIKKLAAERAPSGIEQNRAAMFIELAKNYKISEELITRDKLGNVIIRIPPNSYKLNETRKIAIIGHLDEIGATIFKIKENGHILLQKRGGFESRWLISRKIKILNMDGSWINGIILGRTVHSISPELRNKPNPEVNQLEVFIGKYTKEDVLALNIHVGAPVVFEGSTEYLNPSFDEDLILSNSLDNIISLIAILELIARNKGKNPYKSELVLVATVREEIGREGALFMARNIHPDICIAIDFAVVETDNGAIDCGGNLTGGPMIVWAEAQGRGILDYSLAKQFCLVAKEAQIQYQNGVFEYYGSDAGIIQKDLGIPSLLLGIPIYAGHNVPEIFAISEVDKCVDLIDAWLTKYY